MPRYPFNLNPRLIQLFGQQLVSDAFRALSEVVKNSYDADATRCEVTLDADKRTMTVSDNGTGMGLKTIKGGWLELGTPAKDRLALSSGRGRPVSGSMGIGRMALASLGASTLIQTGTSKSQWRAFEFAPAALATAALTTKPTVDVRKINKPDGALADHGTVVTIHGLPDDFFLETKEQGFESIKRQLRYLVSPAFPSDGREDEFQLSVRNKGAAEEPLARLEIPDNPPLLLELSIDSAGAGTFKIHFNADLYRKSRKLTRTSGTLKGSFPGLRNMEAIIAWRPLGERPGEQFWKSSAFGAAGSDSGILVYRDDIRVLPYGGPGNDWLGLDSKAAKLGPLARYPRSNQLVGYAAISRIHNPRLLDTTNRDGLIANSTFHELKEALQAAVMELRWARRELEPPPVADAAKTHEDPVKVADRARKSLAKLQEEFSNNKKAMENLDDVSPAVEGYEDLARKNALYRERISGGVLAALVLHDSGINLKQFLPTLRKATKLSCDEELHGESLTVLDDVMPRVVTGYDLLRGASRAEGYRKDEFDASITLDKIRKQFGRAIDRQFTIHYKPTKLIVSMRESELWSIAVNLLHNAITCGEYLHERATAAPFPTHREISVETYSSDDALVLVVEDNGPGLPSNRPAEWIWELFSSTRGDAGDDEAGGSGIGLWIVSDLVSGYGGSALAGPSKKYPTGARFEIVIPKVVVS